MMTIQTINGQRVLTPDENMYLYNAKENVASEKVFLGINADESEWSEITTEEYETLLFDADEEATETDYLEALSKLGVSI